MQMVYWEQIKSKSAENYLKKLTSFGRRMSPLFLPVCEEGTTARSFLRPSLKTLSLVLYFRTRKRIVVSGAKQEMLNLVKKDLRAFSFAFFQM
jgi:hypothetical protein